LARKTAEASPRFVHLFFSSILNLETKREIGIVETENRGFNRKRRRRGWKMEDSSEQMGRQGAKHVLVSTFENAEHLRPNPREFVEGAQKRL
jgi:hypothetical protein